MRTSARIVMGIVWLAACGDDDGGGSDAAVPGPDAPGLACPEPPGAGTEHSLNVVADETWTAADSPHLVTSNINVLDSTLTIEPCAVVRLGPGYTIHLREGPGGLPSAIVAHGEQDRPIRFERADASAPWGMILAYPPGTIDFEHVTLTGGGDHGTAQSGGGTIVAAGAAGAEGLTPMVRLVDVTVEDSAGYGVNLRDRAAFVEGSGGLVIRGAGSVPPFGTAEDPRYPISVDGPALASIPVGTYTGNAIDEILLGGPGNLRDPSITFRNRGVPYHVLTDFSMQPPMTAAMGGLSTLNIEAGVVIKFNNGSPSASWGMTLGASGGDLPENIWPVRVIAQGTSTAPIVLTSAEATPAAGDWAGIAWSGGPGTGNVMSFVRIEYAGADSGTQGFGCGPGDNDAALIFANWVPLEDFITDCTISDSAGGGIVSGWATDAGGPDFSSGNTFTNIGNGCNVSRWWNGDGSCPGTPPICL